MPTSAPTNATSNHTDQAIKRIAIIGVSHRSIKLSRVLRDEVEADHWQIAGLWDVDPKRFQAYTIAFPDQTAVPTYLGDESLERMLDEVRPDVALVCTMDRYHAPVAIRCLQRGIDVVVEKPMVIDCQQAQDLLDAEAASTAGVHVAFNYRYQQQSRMLKQLLDQQTIGRVTAVEMNVYLNEIHGSSFFQRWNRYRANSGGLTIHKEGHYLDMLCWWLNQKPVEVFCYGALNYYGPEGEMNPSRKDGRVCHDCDEIDRCAYQQVRRRKNPVDTHIGDLQKISFNKRDQNHHLYTGYTPDMCIFDSDIDIEDTYSAVIKFDGGTFVNFSVNFSSPFEQHRLTFNGTRGRLETGYPFAKGALYDQGHPAIVHYPLFADQAEEIPVKNLPGSHGGGDKTMLTDIMSDVDDDVSRASSRAGAYAVALGEAMWRSAHSGQPVRIADLLGRWY